MLTRLVNVENEIANNVRLIEKTDLDLELSKKQSEQFETKKQQAIVEIKQKIRNAKKSVWDTLNFANLRITKINKDLLALSKSVKEQSDTEPLLKRLNDILQSMASYREMIAVENNTAKNNRKNFELIFSGKNKVGSVCEFCGNSE